MKSILFNTDMVRAILDGGKSVTRRVVKPQPEKGAYSPYEGVGGRVSFRIGERGCTGRCKPPCRFGDILYVKETWREYNGGYIYKTHCDITKMLQKTLNVKILWRPSIHMPKEAARLFLRVTDVRVNRLKEITGEELKLEGIEFNALKAMDSFLAFSSAWDRRIRKEELPIYGWEANPYVWRISFERISKGEATK